MMPVCSEILDYYKILNNMHFQQQGCFERSSNCAEHAIHLSNMHVLVFYMLKNVTVHNSLQKVEVFSRCMIFSKIGRDTAALSQFSVVLSCKIWCFPASVCFSYKATLWRQNINDACKRFRFKWVNLSFE